MRFFTKPRGLSITGLLCVLAVVPSAHADFWVSNSGSHDLQLFNTTTTHATVAQTIGFNVFGTGNNSPEGIALDSANNLWVADGSSPYIAEYTYNQSTGQWKAGASGQPSQVFAVNGNTSGYGALQGLAVYNGSVYVAETTGTYAQSVWQYNISTVKWTEVVSPSSFPTLNGDPSYPYGVAFNSAGNLFVSAATNLGASEILEFTNKAGTWTNTATLTGISNARGLTFDSSGNLLASGYTSSNGSGQVWEYAYNGTSYSTSPTSPVINLSNSQLIGDAFDSTTGYFLVADSNYGQTNEVLAYSLSGGTATSEDSYATDNNPQYLAPFSASPSVSAPTPSGLVLFALGVGGLGLFSRRRSNKIAPHDAAAA